MKLTQLFTDFFNSEKSGGMVLVGCTVISLTLANSGLQEWYISIWNLDIAGHHLTHWINDGLMTIFFLLIGLELEREIYVGELSNMRNASLPILAAMGGMVIPAGIHLALNYGTNMQGGAGIPMATDIAFALGVLSLLGNRIPVSIKIFLTALAVIDDLGAIIVIAMFYTSTISWFYLGIAGSIFAFLLVLNRLKVHYILPYLIGGVGMWYYMLHSGVHATVTGVLLAFAIPFGNGDNHSPSYKIQHFLHKPVAFFILPLFALANTSLILSSHWYQTLLTSNSLGVAFGLFIGKPLGILSFSSFAVKVKLSSLPEGTTWKALAGTGFLGGIGFTMSIFITLLAFDHPSLIEQSKMAVMLASVFAGAVGYVVLRASFSQTAQIT
jgi:NhaA family Na+:H+ antiporter